MCASTIDILRGEDVLRHICGERFRIEYESLLSKCYYTVFQSYDFVKIWYEEYAQFEHVLVCMLDNGALSGVLFLYEQDDCLFGAGGGLAEYQFWVCRPEDLESFVDLSIRYLKHERRSRRLMLKYVPEDLFCKTNIKKLFGVQVEKFSCKKANVYSKNIDKILLNTTNIKRTSRVKRHFNCDFVDIDKNDPRLFAFLQNTLVFAAIRHDAFHGTCNAECGVLLNKLRFLKRLVEDTSEASFVCLCSGDNLIASHYGVISRNLNTFHLMIPSFNFYYSKYSPGKITLLYILDMCRKLGISSVDMTPGDDKYKEQYDDFVKYYYCIDVPLVTCLACWMSIYKFLRRVLRPVFQSFGINYIKLRDYKNKLSRLIKIGVASCLLAKFNEVYYCLFGYTQFVYCLSKPFSVRFLKSNKIKMNDVKSLLKYTEKEPRCERSVFLINAIQRLESGDSFFSFSDENNILHYGWANFDNTQLYYVNLANNLNVYGKIAYLYDFYTMPSIRRRGLCRDSLSHIMSIVEERVEIGAVFVSVFSDNNSGRLAVQGFGFKFVDKIRVEGFICRVVHCIRLFFSKF